MIQIPAFKQKEKEESEGRPQLGGHWKVPMLSGPWKVPMFGGLGRRRKNIIFTFSYFPPNKFYLNFFLIDFKVLFYHSFRPLLYVFPSFSLTYKLQPRISMYQVFHTFITKLILIEYFFHFLNSWHHA
jgi:hypothetical protein